MNLENLVAVSGMPGIYKVVTSRSNGLVVEDLDTAKKKFAPARKHQFTPLETIAIYTTSDSTPLDEVFKSILNKKAELPVVSAKGNNAEIATYFKEILPDYDPDRVLISDMKKVIKWYLFLEERGYVTNDEEE